MLVMDGDREEATVAASPNVPDAAESGREEEVSDEQHRDSRWSKRVTTASMRLCVFAQGV